MNKRELIIKHHGIAPISFVAILVLSGLLLVACANPTSNTDAKAAAETEQAVAKLNEVLLDIEKLPEPKLEDFPEAETNEQLDHIAIHQYLSVCIGIEHNCQKWAGECRKCNTTCTFEVCAVCPTICNAAIDICISAKKCRDGLEAALKN